MKKFTCLMLALMLCICAASCGEPSPSPTDPPVQPDVTETVPPMISPYDAIIKEYETAIADGLNPAEMLERGLNYLVPQFLSENEQEHAGYYVCDLNNDGQDELIIAAESENEFYTGMIFELYTLKDGKPVLMAESGERDRWYYVGDGKLYNTGSDGASELNSLICSAGDLSVLDGVKYDSREYPDDPWLHFDGGEWKHITEDDATAFMAEMQSSVSNPELTAFG